MTGITQTTRINVPSIQTSNGIVIPSNSERLGWSIQNLGTNALFVCLGSTASTSIFHFVLKGGSVNDDVLGALISETTGTIYTGAISVFGCSPALLSSGRAR